MIVLVVVMVDPVVLIIVSLVLSQEPSNLRILAPLGLFAAESTLARLVTRDKLKIACTGLSNDDLLINYRIV
jgi:hypothetical protein